jgi:UbiD family decarboxylase
MAFRNLRSFVHELERRRDLVVIDAPVDAKLEVAEIHRRVIAAGGPALFFRNIKGHSFPVLTNMFGSRERVELAFGNKPKDFVKQVARLPDEILPPSIAKLWGIRHMGKDLLRIGLKTGGRAPVLEKQITGADLTKLPALTSWSEDGGPFLTLPLVHTRGSGKKPDNLGMYRVQIHDAKECGMHFQIGKGAGFHLWEAEQRGEAMPVNVYLGGPPALILAAIAPLPENVPELLLASMVQGARLKCGKIKDWPLNPVAEAEFCISGTVPPGVRRPEGPFGDHYGYYSLRHDYPVLQPQWIHHRKDAIFPATVVGKPRQEDFFIGDWLQELLLPLIPLVMPGVRDLWSYGETGYHALAGAVLKERYGRESMSSVFRILGEGQLSLTKFLLAVDKPMDLRDFRGVLTHILERFDPRTDVHVFSELAMDTLDYAGPAVNKGSKGVILGLGEKKRSLPNEIPAGVHSPLIKNASLWIPGCLVVESVPWKEDPTAAAQIAKIDAFAQWPMIVVVDDVAKATKSETSFLWTTFTRFDPGADLHSARVVFERGHAQRHGPIVIDARMKPTYPDELFCDPETAKLVSQRWKEYFPDRSVEMGNSDVAHL